MHVRLLACSTLSLAVAATTIISAAGVATAVPTPRSGPAASVPVQPPLPFPVPPAPPEFDPAFYDPPPDVVASTAPGGLIAARQVHLATLSVIPTNVDAWQVSYRSNDHLGHPLAAVATVMKPRGAAKGPRPLLSFQSAEDSLGRYCAPSYTFQQASVPFPATGSMVAGVEFLQVQAALTQGWAVVVPDSQGPRAAYAAGPLEGRITLDGIRAAENFQPLGLDGSATRVGMAGYSGGAIATNWAAELHRSYAPDLNIVGTAAGGTQPDLAATLNLANGNLASGLILAAVIGISREYPELAGFIDQHVTPAGRALIDAKQNLCVGYTSALLPFTDNKGLMGGGDPLQAPPVRKVIDELRLGRDTPDMPLYQYQSNPDYIAPVGPVNKLMGTYCEDPNAKVTYVRDNFSEHLSVDAAATGAWMLWMRDRFAGVPVDKGCAMHDVGSIALDKAAWPVWTGAVGEVLAGLLGKPLGT